MTEPDVRVYIHPSNTQEPEDHELICNWCGIPHPCTRSYRDDILKRGAEKIAEAELGDQITPEQTWTCGRCILALEGLPPDLLRTDCPDHDVPKEKQT